MRTKVLLGLAVGLAVGLSTAMAQNVYSVNVVGYVNVSLHNNQFSFLSLPLAPVNGDHTIGNNIVLDNGDGTQDGANLYRWNSDIQNWDGATVWFGGAWDNPSMVISNGAGFFLASVADSTLTFVGQVNQGPFGYSIPVGVGAIGNAVAVSTNFPGDNDTGFYGNDGDNLYTWNQAIQNWNGATVFFGGVWDVADQGPVMNPADAAFYLNSGGSPITFTRSFTVQ